jgi:DivIVA domain-containing protein
MQHALSPEELESITFSTSLRGYDRDEVDEFLRTLAADLKESQKARADRLYENLGEEMGGLLQHARDSADQMLQEAEAEARRLREEAQEEARRTREAAAAHARSTKEESEMTAQRTIEDANLRARETRDEAEHDAAVRIEATEARVRKLEETEADVRERIRVLRLHLVSLSDQLQEIAAPAETEEVVLAEEESETGSRSIHLEHEVEGTSR